MVDKKVVIPDDMGAGLKFENNKWNVNAGKGLTINQTTNQIEIKTGGGSGGTGTGSSTGVGVDDEGRLTTQISTDAGNLLELRENGIYYGIYPIQSSFYVDSTEGNDNNDGATPERPMKTIQKAVDSMTNGPYEYNIYLRCNKHFDFCYAALNLVSKINILPYGPETSMYPLGIPNDALYWGSLATSFPRPTINIRTKPTNMLGSTYMARNYLIVNNIYITGMILDVDITPKNDDGSHQGYLPGIFESQTNLFFDGCDINVYGNVVDVSSYQYKYRYDALFRGPSIMFGSCKWRNKIPINSGGVGYIDTININVFNRMGNYGHLTDPTGRYPNYPIFTSNDILPNLPLNTIRQFGQYDVATKTLFGFTTSWDIFQYPN